MRLRLARSISPAEMVPRVDLPWSTTDASPGVKSGGGDGMSTESSSVKYGSRPCLSHASIGNAARAASTARPTATKQICRIVTVAVPIAVLAPQEDSSPRQMVQGYAVAAWALRRSLVAHGRRRLVGDCCCSHPPESLLARHN